MNNWDKVKFGVVVVPMAFSETLNQRIDNLRREVSAVSGKVLNTSLTYSDGALVYVVEYLSKEDAKGSAK